MTQRLHNTLEWIEEDFNAGRITFREALEAYREEIEADNEEAIAQAYEEGHEEGYDTGYFNGREE